jgi:protein phosphatase
MVEKNEADTVEIEGAPAPLPAPAERPRPFSSLVRVDLGARTDQGRVRPNNEDHYLVARVDRALETLRTSLPEGDLPAKFEEVGYILIVCDGMGGAAAGEVASKQVIHLAVNLLLSRAKWHQKIAPSEVGEVLERMRRDVRRVDAALVEQARAEPALHGMGTTVTAAYSVGADLFLVHVGDSRAYLYRRGKLHQLTPDHTMAQHLADAGFISQDEVAHHRLRHVLTNVMGGPGEVAAFVDHLRLFDGDVLLLCSDGLTEMVEDAAIAEVLAGQPSSEAASSALVDRALERGGKDNVTVLVARYTLPPE